MKIAIMQPYFFPYLGYFGLIKNTDRWIVFDSPQFIYHGWIERNRILRPVEGWQYIQVPLAKHKRSTTINNIRIRVEENWKETLKAKLLIYKKIAPYYNLVSELIINILNYDTDSIVKLNCHIIQNICLFLNIEWKYSIFSNMGLNIERPAYPDEWALNICKCIEDVTEYWNLPGGKNFFNEEKYSSNNIGLRFYNQILKPYDQRRNQFEPALSIIDILMFNSVSDINLMLNDYEFI